MDTKNTLINLLKKQTKLKDIKLETPPSPDLGDFAFPCFQLSKKYKKNPVEIASLLAKKFKPSSLIKQVKATGPYLNFFINQDIIVKQTIKQILKQKNKYGSSNEKNKIMVEFSQPNTHKAFHVGHIRGTSLGESLARILEFRGNKIIRANYSGDTGMHIAKWIWCYKKYHSKEKLKDDGSWISSIYVDAVKKLDKNPKLQEEVNEINRKLEQEKDKKLINLWKKTRKLSIKSWKKIYKELNTKFNIYYFESEVEKRGKEITQQLLKKGIAKIDNGATIIDLKKYNLSVWVLLRSDGTVLYSVKDLALAEKKFKKFKINKSIIIMGAAQSLHSLQLSKTLELMKFPHYKDYNFVCYSEVRLPTGKMSSRTGENILYSEFKKEIINYAEKEIKQRFPKISKKELEKRALAISIAAIKYNMLKQDSNKNITFNKEEALSFEGNTGPYLQYTHARACSILKRAKKTPKIDYSLLNKEEIELVKKLSYFPEIILKSSKELKPNLIANYLYELSKQFNEFYHKYSVIKAPLGLKNARIDLVKSTKQVLNNGLNLLGITPLEHM